MFGLFKLNSVVTGSCRQRDCAISLVNAGGAEAVSAIKGASVSALMLPRLRNASRKLGPLKQDKRSALASI